MDLEYRSYAFLLQNLDLSQTMSDPLRNALTTKPLFWA